MSKTLASISLALSLSLSSCGGERPTSRSAPGMSGSDYDRWRQPERVVAALRLSKGDAVADVGAGRGYFSGRLARAVGPPGRVTATDIDPLALLSLATAGTQPGAATVEPRLVAAHDPGLETAAYDRILLAQVDHLLSDRVDYLRRLRRALAAGGLVAVQNRLQHRSELLGAAAAAGYDVIAEVTDLPGQYLVLLEPNRRGQK